MFIRGFLLATFAFLVNASVTDYINDSDFNRYAPQLVKVLANLKEIDFASEFYSLKTFSIFDYELPLKLYWESCALVDENFNVNLSIEEIYYTLSSWTLASCEKHIKVLKENKNDAPRVQGLKGKLPTEDIVKKIKSILDSDKSTIAEIRYALESLVLLKQPIPNPSKIAQRLQALLKNDDSLQSYGHVLHAASLLKNDGAFALQLVEDVVVQADEVNGKMLQWEGGLITTSSLITGLFRLPGAKPFTQAQADKFATYLMTRKFIQSPRGILALVEASRALVDSPVSPVCVTHVTSNQITIDNAEFKVKVSDLFGKSLKSAVTSVVAQSATRVNDDVVVLSKQPFTSTSDPTVFSLQLKLEPETYRLVLSVASHTATVTVHVLGPVSVQWLEVGISDADGSSAPRLTKLQYPSKLTSVLQSDASQHLVVRFALTKPVHQAFLRLFAGNQEIIFIAEQNDSKVYKIGVHLGSELSVSTLYNMELILGDFSMSNKIKWQFGEVDVKLGAPNPVKVATKGPKPEIRHLFRPAEKRPPTTVSMLFTGLVLAPIGLLFIFWFSIGINFKNFTFSTFPFHLGFGSILGLFVLFWLKLNMFQTAALLIPLGTFTFLAGHKALKSLSNQKST